MRLRVLTAAFVAGCGFAAAPRAAAQGASPSISADWLQGNALPLGRDATPSGAVTLGFPALSSGWAFGVGYLRAARSLSTAQGGFVTVTRPMRAGGLLFAPGVGVVAGTVAASRDTTGYNWTGASGTAGHQPRYDYSDAATVGGGAMLSIEFPADTPVALRASVAEWMFSGAPLTGDRDRTLVGAGLVVRWGRP